MTSSSTVVYLSSLLLEKNRWNGKGPSLLVSDWMGYIGEAGYAGVDLWMNHLRFTSRSEWELIQEQSQASDLSLACISATVPTDASDKSQRLREAIIEACDYFNPDSLRFAFTDPNREGFGKKIQSGELEFMNTWSKDLPRETGLIFEAGNLSFEDLLLARETLDPKRFKAAIQPFLMSANDLEKSLKIEGKFICNLGVQAKQGKDWILLADKSAEIKQAVAFIRKEKFTGTWTLEGTDGMGAKAEDIDEIFDNAESDLNFLVDAINMKEVKK